MDGGGYESVGTVSADNIAMARQKASKKVGKRNRVMLVAKNNTHIFPTSRIL